ncbi:MAG: DUF2817 domain-containing protein [Armatimonadota bacterium]
MTAEIRHYVFALAMIVILLFVQYDDAFSQSSNYTLKDALHEINQLKSQFSVRAIPYGTTPENRTISSFIITDFSVPSENKIRVMLISGQHGDEVNAVRATLSTCKTLASGVDENILKKFIIIVVPIVNPDGFSNKQRTTSQDIDLNRDWIVLSAPENQYVHSLIEVWRPHLIIDVHEWTGPTELPANSIEIPRSIDESRARAMQDLGLTVKENAGLDVIQCTAYADPRLFHRRYSSLGYASFMLETDYRDSYKIKEEHYTAAIFGMIHKLESMQSKLYVMSPSAQEFNYKVVSAYTKYEEKKEVSYAILYIFFIVGSFYVVLLFIIKPLSNSISNTKWSHLFLKCEVDEDIITDRIIMKHRPQPLVYRSWAKRRLRKARKEPPKPKRDRI